MAAWQKEKRDSQARPVSPKVSEKNYKTLQRSPRIMAKQDASSSKSKTSGKPCVDANKLNSDIAEATKASDLKKDDEGVKKSVEQPILEKKRSGFFGRARSGSGSKKG